MNSYEIVIEFKEKHSRTWRDKPDWFWFICLIEEVIELGLALLGLHRHSPEYEMAQISSICMNWMEKRERSA